MTYRVRVFNPASNNDQGRIFDLDDLDQVKEYMNYTFDCICFDTIICLEPGEQFTITCIERDY